ncbi:MlaD family protein [Nocardia sp. CA-151230]|uniref:MlaD family protein n=1 Tax=Nocardia sp. CA-151230 TaxID=3239982 RepID=UPI003D8BB540
MRRMALYGLPGVAMDSRSSRRTGAVAAMVVAVALAAGICYRSLRTDEDSLRVQVVAEQLGDGIVTGSQVRLDGVLVGSVESIDSAGPGRLRMTLALTESRLPGVTDSLSLLAAPGNLFGISELDLQRGTGGSPLRSGTVIELTGPAAQRLSDATTGALLRQLGQTTNQVLTPQLADVLRQVSTDSKAFTPLFEAMVTTSRSIADTQKYAPSYLIGQYAGMLAGLPPFLTGTIQLLDSLDHMEPLRTDRAAFDKTVAAIADDLLPGATHTLTTAREELNDYAGYLIPLLAALGAMVSTPQQSSAELHELLNRLGAAMPDGPDGPTLNLRITLSGVPVLSSILLGQAPGVAR